MEQHSDKAHPTAGCARAQCPGAVTAAVTCDLLVPASLLSSGVPLQTLPLCWQWTWSLQPRAPFRGDGGVKCRRHWKNRNNGWKMNSLDERWGWEWETIQKVRKRRGRERELPLRSNNPEEKGKYLKANMENRYHKVCAKACNKNEDKDGGGMEWQDFDF